ncbi:MAG: AraC family transcriptional regulator [Clostridiales Family XIII bacterium]|jgi:AraC-like DNA-binding protein|nr:AraC family transcriptional regulator [Clostridiales Family XIII bacterium]
MKDLDYKIEYFNDSINCYNTESEPINNLHLHNHYELYLFLDGDVRFFIDGHSIKLKRGNLLFLKNNQVHGPLQLSDNPQARLTIHFSPQIVAGFESGSSSNAAKGMVGYMSKNISSGAASNVANNVSSGASSGAASSVANNVSSGVSIGAASNVANNVSSGVSSSTEINATKNVVRSDSKNGNNLLDCFTRDYKHFPMIRLNEDQIETMSRVYDQIVAEQSNPSQENQPRMLSALLTQLLIYANRFNKASAVDKVQNELSPLISDLINYLQETITNPELNLELIEKEFNINSSYINKLFKKELGSSIYHYILLSRIAIAKRLLESGLSVTDTCEQSGFNDYSNFIRAFKKVAEVSPKQYAKMQENA